MGWDLTVTVSKVLSEQQSVQGLVVLATSQGKVQIRVARM